MKRRENEKEVEYKETVEEIMKVMNRLIIDQYSEPTFLEDELLLILEEDSEIEHCTSCGLLKFVDERCSCLGLELAYCPNCGKEYDDYEIRYELETEEFWGAPTSRKIVIGAECSFCGYVLEA